MPRNTALHIDLGAIGDNVALLRQQLGSRAFMAVVKADAYGHGATPVATHIEHCLLYTSPSPRDVEESRMPSSA